MNREDKLKAQQAAFMEMAEEFQHGWSLIVSMLTGAVKEMTDQGWPEDQARALVLTIYMKMVGSNGE